MPIHITNSGSSTCKTDRSHTHASLILLAQLKLLLLMLLLPLIEPYPAAAAAASAARLDAELWGLAKSSGTDSCSTSCTAAAASYKHNAAVNGKGIHQHRS
jgi:hypothetical protein